MDSSRRTLPCTVTLAVVALAALALLTPADCVAEPVSQQQQAVDLWHAANPVPLTTEELVYKEAPITFQLDVNGAAAVQLLGPVLDAVADIAREQLPSLVNMRPQSGGPGASVFGLLVSSAPQLIGPAKGLIESITRVTLLGMRLGDSAPLGEVHAYYEQLMTQRGWTPLATLRTESNEGLLLLIAPGGKGLFGVVRPNQRELIVGMITASKPIGELVAPIIRVGGPLLMRTFSVARMREMQRQQAAVREQAAAMEIAVAMEKDPKVGRKIDLPPVEDLEGNAVRLPLDREITALLYYPGSYNETEVRLLDSETAMHPDVRGCVVFAGADPKDVAEEVREEDYHATFLYDRTGELGKALNSHWEPRLYIIGGDGTMIFVENSAAPAEEIISDAKAALAKALGFGEQSLAPTARTEAAEQQGKSLSHSRQSSGRRPAEVTKSNQLDVVDSQGRKSATLWVEDSSQKLSLWRKDGKASTTLWVKDGSPSFSVWKKDGKACATLWVKDDEPRVSLWKPGGTAAATVWVKGGNPSLSLWKEGGKACATLLVEDGNPKVSLWKPGGEAAATLWVKDASPSFSLWRKDGKASATLRIEDDTPTVSLWDRVGNAIATLRFADGGEKLLLHDRDGKVVWEAPTVGD